MRRKLSPFQRHSLRVLDSGRYLMFRPQDVPGGERTIRALVVRGLMERDPSGHVRITTAGHLEANK